MAEFTVNSHFDGKNPVVRAIYDQLVTTIRQWGDLGEEPKKGSIHLIRKSAIAGVSTGKNWLDLNIKTNYLIEHVRIRKREQVSKSRYHHLVRLTTVNELDKELLSWLKDAYEISG